MDDENIVLRPFEKPLNTRFHRPIKDKPKPIVEAPKPEADWASWDKPSEAPSKPIELPPSKPEVDKSATTRAANNSPGLNLKHGFIRSIRYRISKNLTKKSLAPKDDASSSHGQLHVAELKLCTSGGKREENVTKTSKLKTPTAVTNTVRTEAESKRPTKLTPGVGGGRRVYRPRESVSEAVKSKSDTCLSLDTKCHTEAKAEPTSSKSERPRRRRPSMQIYQPPGRRHQAANSHLGEIESYERRGMTSGDEDVRTTSTLDPIMSNNSEDPEVKGLGMPLRRTIAQTNLVNRTKGTMQVAHTKNNPTVPISKTRSTANSWSFKTNRRVFMSADSSVMEDSSPEKCNGESSSAPEKCNGESFGAPKKWNQESLGAPEKCNGESFGAPEKCNRESSRAPKKCNGESSGAPEKCNGESFCAPEKWNRESFCAPEKCNGESFCAPEKCNRESFGAPEKCNGESFSAPEKCNRESSRTPEKCNGESSDVDSGATKLSTPTKTITKENVKNIKPDNPGSLVTNDSANTIAASDVASGDNTGKFGYLDQMFQLDVSFIEVDVKGYPDWARRYIFEAYHDPKLVSEEILAEIGLLIAERAWAVEEQDNYHRTAARLCQRIAKKEYDNEETATSVQSLPFQRGVLDGCYKAFQRRRLQTKDTWRTYATFCSDLLQRLHFGLEPPTVLCTLVLNLLEQSATTLVDSPVEVETVAEMLARCGPQLELVNMSRLEKFLDQLVTNLLTSTDPIVKLNLCLIQEMHAGGWFLSRVRRAYYRNS